MIFISLINIGTITHMSVLYKDKAQFKLILQSFNIYVFYRIIIVQVGYTCFRSAQL